MLIKAQFEFFDVLNESSDVIDQDFLELSLLVM
jgi:hypothetical protein